MHAFDQYDPALGLPVEECYCPQMVQRSAEQPDYPMTSAGNLKRREWPHCHLQCFCTPGLESSSCKLNGQLTDKLCLCHWLVAELETHLENFFKRDITIFTIKSLKENY